MSCHMKLAAEQILYTECSLVSGFFGDIFTPFYLVPNRQTRNGDFAFNFFSPGILVPRNFSKNIQMYHVCIVWKQPGALQGNKRSRTVLPGYACEIFFSDALRELKDWNCNIRMFSARPLRSFSQHRI